MSPRVSRGFPAMLDLLQPERTWIVAPVQEGYLKVPGVKVLPWLASLDKNKY